MFRNLLWFSYVFFFYSVRFYLAFPFGFPSSTLL
jgi:hypothetical protein